LYIHISFVTSRFHLHKFERRFDKSICIGDDVATWLGEHLKVEDCDCYGWRRSGEDGWQVDVRCEGQSYSIDIRAMPVDVPQAIDRPPSANWFLDNDRAEWSMVVAKKRSLVERFLFRNRLGHDDGLCRRIYDLLKRQFDFTNVNKRRLGTLV
jgi:hypothetical protein